MGGWEKDPLDQCIRSGQWTRRLMNKDLRKPVVINHCRWCKRERVHKQVEKNTELSPAHVFECPAVLAALQEIVEQGEQILFLSTTSMWIIRNRLPEQSARSMILFDLVQS
ncbi:hypothetical protein TNCV_1070111 [Trichonephila clavipes]|nr:hypothetical protein TNCV_1070111 [Trichonephila clavipes]